MSTGTVLNAETIDMFYLLFLGRLPESDAVAENFVKCFDFKDMRNIVVGSPEFMECAPKNDRRTKIPFFDALHIDKLNVVMRCLEHLTTLKLLLAVNRIADVGLAMVLMAAYFMERRCKVDLFDSSLGKVNIAKTYLCSSGDENPLRNVHLSHVDFDTPGLDLSRKFDARVSYDTLWKSSRIVDSCENLDQVTDGMLILETRLAFGDGEDPLIAFDRDAASSNKFPLIGNIRTLTWVWNTLSKHFPFVYVPHTQPHHRGFPTSWHYPPDRRSNFGCAIFVESRTKLGIEALSPQLVACHTLPDSE